VGGGGTGASREELEEAVKQLVAALDAKTGELEALAARLEQVTGDRDMLESKHSELAERATDLDLQNARLRELVKKHDVAQARRAEDSARAAQLETELAASQQRAAQAASTVAVREHQNRVLRIHLQQLSEELHAKDAKIKAVLQDKQALADSLAERLKDVAALQLDPLRLLSG
jgi:chromosome segregation ATPase